jgi:hypothetical protein
MRFGRGSRAENISFSNLVFRNVTGPISIGRDSTRRRPSSTQAATTTSTSPATTQGDRGYVRNVSFNGISGNVVAQGFQHEDLPFPSDFRPGEVRSCIVLNGARPDDVIENISVSNVHLTFAGGGTAEEATREIPAMAGEYFEIGTPPAFGVYARNVRGLSMHNVRLEAEQPDARPAVVFDRVTDASVVALAADGDPRASAVIRCMNSRDVYVASPRVLTSAGVFLRSEGRSADITLDGGDLSKAGTPRA